MPPSLARPSRFIRLRKQEDLSAERVNATLIPDALTWPWTCGFLTFVFSLWSVVGRYPGITHDALLYVLQAVARLQPDPLAQDIFLRYQSQDQFTIFSILCAEAVRILGVDRAAVTLSAVFLATWFIVAWAVARRLQNSKLALLSLSFVLVVPGWYSAMQVFRFAEPFMTARCFGEALSLAALLAALYARWLLAAALVMLALLIHPLMAFPAVALLAVLRLPHHDWKILSLALGVLVVGAISGSFVLGLPDPMMHGEWLAATRVRSNFLFTDQWSPADWEVVSIVLGTLALGSLAVPRGQAQVTLVSALIVGVAGVLLAVVSSQLFELKILLQGQPWRWLWIGRVLATLLLPLIVLNLWRDGRAGQSVAMLVIAAWLLSGAGSHRYVPPIGVSGLLCAIALVTWLTRGVVEDGTQSLIRGMSVGALVLVGASFAATIFVVVNSQFSFGRDPFLVQRIHDAIGIPGIAAATSCLAWLALIHRKQRTAGLLLVTFAVLLLAGAAPETVRRWTKMPHNDSGRAEFAGWRAQIPKEAEVFWPGAPQGPWLLLDRRSYMTVAQAAGSVFSEATTAELLRRSEVLAPLIAPGYWFLDPKAAEEEPKDLTLDILQQICVDPELSFVVSGDHVQGALGRAEWPGKADFLYLYDCTQFRRGSTE